MASLQFDPHSPSIIVKAKIETAKGLEYASLVFDTGASLVMLPWGLSKAVELTIDLDNTIKTTTVSSVETSPLTTIPKLSVLGHTVEHVECIIRDLPKESYVDGLLGLSFMRHFNIILNFEQGILTIEPIDSK